MTNKDGISVEVAALMAERAKLVDDVAYYSGNEPAGRAEIARLNERIIEAQERAYLALSEREAAKDAEIAEFKAALSDPSAVHLNMLRGGIARPSPANIWHLYQRELLDAMPQEFRAALNQGKD